MALLSIVAIIAVIAWMLGVFIRRRYRSFLPAEVAKHISGQSGHLAMLIPRTVIDPLCLLSAVEMSRRLREGSVTSLRLVDACIDAISRVNPHVNAVVFDRFETARAEAKQADALISIVRSRADRFIDQAGKDKEWATLGWLTGVPCTIKECFGVVGCPQTAGHPMRKGRTSTEDAPAVARLRQAGAIVLGVTNLSELCMWMESSNCVYGTTCNAYDLTRTVGGSSGGEGCSVTCGFSPFGLGSDIGGSVRMPAYFNGVFGHKPSSRLVPNKGQHPGCKTLGNLLLSTGPICRHAEDLYPLLCTLAKGGFLENAALLPPCSIEPLLRSPPASVDVSALKFYCIPNLHIPLTPASPLQMAAVRHVAHVLKENIGAKNVHIIDWKPLRSAKANPIARLHSAGDVVPNGAVPAGWHVMSQAFRLWSAAMARDIVTYHSLLSDGYPGENFKPLPEVWKWLRGVSKHTMPSLLLCIGEGAQKFLPKKIEEASLAKLKTLSDDVERVLRGPPGGIIVCPTFPQPAPRHFRPVLRPFSFCYTGLFNALQLPSTACPVWLSQAYLAQKLPLGVQLVGAWGNDHLTIATAVALEKANAGIGHRRPPWMQLGTASPSSHLDQK